MNVDIKALAQLARLEITDAEVAKLEQEIPDILKFVETIQKVSTYVYPSSPALRNVVRADSNPHESGIYTKRLIEAAPAHEGNRVVVKQVVSRKEKNKEEK
jgi:aspartyl/glutamyl-tRNA(Asn/Gln) amidotransferase C subunit